MTYQEATEYIHSLSVFGIKPGLSRIEKLCELLGNPQKGIRFIHIAGTNGKGSVCSMIAEILMSSGYKTGLYTSPYVSFFEERIQINRLPIPKKRLCKITERVKSCADTMADKPTEFEVITAVAFVYFCEEKCDAVVLETGLGGRLDATNVIKSPLLTVITGIGLDHTGILGSTVAEIAAEKGGIIKKGRPLVLAGCPDDAQKVLYGIAKSLGADIFNVDYNRITKKQFSLDSTMLNIHPYGKIKLSLSGVYQADNAAVAVTAAEVLKSEGFDIIEQSIKGGLSKIVWKARFEVISRDPVIIYEGAHNPHGVSALARNIKEILGGKVIFITSVMADKDYTAMAKILAPFADKVFTVKADNPRSLDAAAWADEFISSGADAHPANSVDDALERAIVVSQDIKLPIVICGTLYMYKEVTDAIERIKGI